VRPVFYERRFRPNFGIIGRLLRKMMLPALVALVGWGVYSLVMKVVGEIRGDRCAVEAAQFLAEGRVGEARDKLRMALVLSPRHAEAARMLAGMMDEEGNPRSLDYHLIVFQSDSATENDQRRALAAALRHGDHALAVEWADRIAAAFGDPALPVLTAARIRQHVGDEEGAGVEFRRALAIDENPATLRALADYLLADSEEADGEARAEAIDLIARLGQQPGRDGVEALKDALASGLAVGPRRADFLAALRSHPSAEMRDWIFADAFEIFTDPEAADRVADDASRRLRGVGIEERLEGVRWLLGRGFAEAALEALPAEDAIRSNGAFVCRFDALMDAGRYSEADSLLRDPANPLPPVGTLVRLARVFAERGDLSGSGKLHRRALDASAGEMDMLLREYARLGERERFSDHAEAVFADPAAAPRFLEELVVAARAGGDSAMELAVLESAARFPLFVGDSSLAARIALARFFCAGSIDTDRLQAMGAGLETRLALAAGHLAAGRKAKALYELEQAGIDASTTGLGDSGLLVLAGVLVANGREAEAAEAALRIEPANLTRQERDFLRRTMEGIPRI
jgi:hypothetical protein